MGRVLGPAFAASHGLALVVREVTVRILTDHFQKGIDFFFFLNSKEALITYLQLCMSFSSLITIIYVSSQKVKDLAAFKVCSGLPLVFFFYPIIPNYYLKKVLYSFNGVDEKTVYL